MTSPTQQALVSLRGVRFAYGEREILRGVEIDFVDRGMGQASFVFNNVFAAVGGSGGCSACGSSGGGCG